MNDQKQRPDLPLQSVELDDLLSMSASEIRQLMAAFGVDSEPEATGIDELPVDVDALPAAAINPAGQVLH